MHAGSLCCLVFSWRIINLHFQAMDWLTCVQANEIDYLARQTFGEMKANLKANGFDPTSGELPFFDRGKKIPFSSFPLSLSLSKVWTLFLSLEFCSFPFCMVWNGVSVQLRPNGYNKPKIRQSKETHQDWFVLGQFLENCSQFSLCKTVF